MILTWRGALIVGVSLGLLGSGGLILTVPAFVLLARHPLREAIGTSLAMIALNAAVGFLAHLAAEASRWRELDPGLMSVFIAIGIAGFILSQLLPAFVQTPGSGGSST